MTPPCPKTIKPTPVVLGLVGRDASRGDSVSRSLIREASCQGRFSSHIASFTSCITGPKMIDTMDNFLWDIGSMSQTWKCCAGQTMRGLSVKCLTAKVEYAHHPPPQYSLDWIWLRFSLIWSRQLEHLLLGETAQRSCRKSEGPLWCPGKIFKCAGTRL